MLEQNTLILQPQTNSSTFSWRIFDVTQETELGYAQQVIEGNAWLRWWTKPHYHIHESDDEPLVFTMQQGWAWVARWDVTDAEDRFIGRIRGDVIFDRRLTYLARLDWDEETQSGLFLDAQQQELATFERENQSWRLTFSSEDLHNPFVRMLLLAAGLGRLPLTLKEAIAANHVTS